MVRARRAFFDEGHFSSVADCLAQTVLEGVQRWAPSSTGPVTVLDAGCGEGRYIGEVQQLLSGAGYTCDCLGVDISPLAVKLAARKYEGVRFAVANSFHLPFRDASFDCIVTAFSPWPVTEFRRVLRPGGFVVAAGPGEEHLLGLKAVLYDRPVLYQPREFGSSTVGGAVEASHPDRPPRPEIEKRVLETLNLVSGEDAKNLLQMTPYWWKATEEQQRRIGDLTSLHTPIDVRICCHRYDN
uniref:Methyltransferase domain-containing protein n=1 Tax=Tetraselmis chuii TaxID=63592 RepID=A0A7S1SKK7_9CHLO|mmetsp:Transcript_1585/g.2777  ORF Transcript_1585/g.2777 Transcript_1585/m.2777 type:complete len:241 (+) Transcript_1585:390-1112(+)